MAIITYEFDYCLGEASCTFEVNTDLFTKEMAQETLNFFTWDYDKDNDPVDEVMKKYAMEAIQIASRENYNTYGVSSEFDDNEGFCKVDGSLGITLIDVVGYEFNENALEVLEKTIK